jgi:predicted secreted Zn-dependent protease
MSYALEYVLEKLSHHQNSQGLKWSVKDISQTIIELYNNESVFHKPVFIRQPAPH